MKSLPGTFKVPGKCKPLWIETTSSEIKAQSVINNLLEGDMRKKTLIFICIAVFMVMGISLDVRLRSQTIDVLQQVSVLQQARDQILLHVKDFSISQTGDPGDFFPLMAEEMPFIYRYVSSLAISPDFANDRTVFAGVYNGGVFKSTDAGETWLAINEGLTALQVKALAISPDFANDRTIFMGRNTETSAGGVCKSIDAGEHWSQFKFSPGSVECLTISPSYANDQTIFLGSTTASLEYSNDGGETWHQNNPGHSQVYDIALVPDYPDSPTIFAGAGSGIHKSDDDGQNWTWVYGEQTIDWLPYQVNGLAVSPNFAVDSTIIAGTYLGLVRSVDAGTSWEFISTLAVSDVCFSPNYHVDQTVYVAAVGGVLKSIDGGDTWNIINQGLTSLTVETVALTPQYPGETLVFAGTHHGLFSTKNETSWESSNDGILLTKGIEQVTNSIFQMDAMPTLAVDSSGGVHIAWEGTFGTEDAPEGYMTDIFYSHNTSGSFIVPQHIELPTGYASIDVTLAADADGYAHIATRRGVDRSNDVDDVIYYISNRDGDFSHPILAHEGTSTAPGGYPWGPSIAVDHNGHAHIAFVGLHTDYIWYMHNSNGTFSTPVEVPEPVQYLADSPSLALDNDNHAHIVYRGIADGESDHSLYYVHNMDGEFSEGIDVAKGSGWLLTRAQLVLDGMGVPHVVYEDGYYTHMQADSFVASVQIDYESRDEARPSIAIDKANFAHIALGQSRDYASNVQGAFYSKQLVTSYNTLDMNVGRRCIGISPDDTVHMVFSMPGSRIAGDVNHDIYHIAFPVEIATPSISIGDSSFYEGNEGVSIAPIPVQLSISSAQTVTVHYTTLDGSAAAGEDYIATSGVLSFSPGTTSETILIEIIGDIADEPVENFFIILTSPQYATLGDDEAECMIKDDDAGAHVLIWNHPNVLANGVDAFGQGKVGNLTLQDESASATALKHALEANGKSVLVTTDLLAEIPSNYEMLCIITADGEREYIIPKNGPEALAIETYIQGGGRAYMEGPELWFWNPKFGGHSFGELFSIEAIAGFAEDFSAIIGSDFALGMDYSYECSTKSFDIIGPTGSAVVIHSNGSPPFDCGVAYKADDYSTIGVTHQFSCLQDGIYTKAELMKKYLTFFDLLVHVSLAYDFAVETGGWYLVSLPLLPDHAQLSSLFPTALSAFTWDVTASTYKQVSELQEKVGYWLAMASPWSGDVGGTQLQKFTGHYEPGWNMIGTVIDTVDFSNPNDTPDNSILIPAYTYDPVTGEYIEATRLIPGNGYWIAVIQECDLTLGGTTPSALKAATPVDASDFYRKYGSKPPVPPHLSSKRGLDEQIPNEFALYQNYPNPFNPVTTIAYDLPRDEHVRLTIYDIRGRLVKTLYDGRHIAGHHELEWSGCNGKKAPVVSGLYFYKLEAGDFSETKRMIFLK